MVILCSSGDMLCILRCMPLVSPTPCKHALPSLALACARTSSFYLRTPFQPPQDEKSWGASSISLHAQKQPLERAVVTLLYPSAYRYSPTTPESSRQPIQARGIVQISNLSQTAICKRRRTSRHCHPRRLHQCELSLSWYLISILSHPSLTKGSRGSDADHQQYPKASKVVRLTQCHWLSQY